MKPLKQVYKLMVFYPFTNDIQFIFASLSFSVFYYDIRKFQKSMEPIYLIHHRELPKKRNSNIDIS